MHIQRLRDLLSANLFGQSITGSEGLSLSFLSAITLRDPTGRSLEYTGIYLNILECTGVYWSILECIGVYGVYLNILECTGVYWSILGYTCVMFSSSICVLHID